ncbi:MAG: DUF2586 family protein [Flavobacteriaceae bacterium]|nr:DUF2586 family protein [Flavobacteriaceae bacterium]
MSNLNAVTISRGRLGANRINNDRAVSGLILQWNTVSIPADNAPLQIGAEPVVIRSLGDAAQYGITPSLDLNNNLFVHRQISEFFRMAGEGTELWLLMVPSQESDFIPASIEKLRRASDGRIRQIGIQLKYESIIGNDTLDGIRLDTWDALEFAVIAAESASVENQPVQILIGSGNSPGNFLNPGLLDIRTGVITQSLGTSKVSLVIGQDYDYYLTRPANLREQADIGTFLGVLSSAAINQNIGDNEAFNLTNSPRKAWLTPGLSDHSKLPSIQQLQSLEDKGYIFGMTYTGLGGVRINNDHVMAPVILDADGNINEHSIALSRTVDDAIRQLRSVYLPKVKKTYQLNSEGKLPEGVRVSLESIGDQVFNDMERAGEISFGKTTVDPDSDLLVAKVLKIRYRIVPTGTIGEISGTINLKNEI